MERIQQIFNRLDELGKQPSSPAKVQELMALEEECKKLILGLESTLTKKYQKALEHCK
ncbi:MAG: hypothetical protein NT165_02370 [Candidatus Falkowbacteria bacterium]|nr:hypothetical protein [Candidatus Falkowbacteria bacterium]